MRSPVPTRQKTSWTLMNLGLILAGMAALAALLLLVPHGWDAKQPYSLHSNLAADYSAEALPLVFAPVSIEIIPEVLEDEAVPGETPITDNIIIPTVTPRQPGEQFTNTPVPTTAVVALTGTPQPTGTGTATLTVTVTLTSTLTATLPTGTRIFTPTPSLTLTPTRTRTVTPTLPGLPTATHTPTRTPTRTVTTPPPTATFTRTPVPPTPTDTATENPYPPPTYVVPTLPTGYP